MKRGSWTFDDPELAARFDDELRVSVPDLAGMRAACLEVGMPFAAKASHLRIWDLGASTGSASFPFFEANDAISGLLFESSPAMRAELQRRIDAKKFDSRARQVRTYPSSLGIPEILRGGIPGSTLILALAVLTLQFLPIADRCEVLRQVKRHLYPTGALIVVEKVVAEDPDVESAMCEAHYRFKRAMGLDDRRVREKAEALEGVMVPLSARMNEVMFARAGFSQAEVFWARLNFRGWILRP